MFNHIKRTFITLGIASGMTAAALTLIHTPEHCRALILKDASKHQRFMDSVAQYQAPMSFHQALGGK